MKKGNKIWLNLQIIICVLSIIALSLNTNAQDYMINFAGTGASSTIDSVKIENITNGTTITILGSDVLHLKGSVGINNLIVKKENIKLYPNPMQGQAELSFYSKRSGNVQIKIFDLSGKEIIKLSNNLLTGNHKYEITGLKEGGYIITINGENYHYEVKLISKNISQNKASIKYLGSEITEEIYKTIKSTRSTVDMTYTIGNSIRYTGFSGNYFTIINDIPTSSKTITFTFAASPPIVITTMITGKTDTSAISGGNVLVDGGAPIIVRGVCWSKSPNPTIADSITMNGIGKGSFTSFIVGLTTKTTYYVKAYATNNLGTSYGSQLSFISLGTPTISTSAITGITANTAVSGGNITSDGGAFITAHGVCWSLNPKPTINDSITLNGTGIGTFTSYITGLVSTTKYYLRAYATNNIGTSYGSEINFTTLTAPTVVTNGVTNVTANTSTTGGAVSSDGGFPVTARGVCWSTSAIPTINDSKTTNGSGTGSFTSIITGLTAWTTYYYRAYATSSAGTGYGSIQLFKTDKAKLPTLTTSGVSTITPTTATAGGNISSDGGAPILERGVCWRTTQNPTTANSKTTDGSGAGNFISLLTGLSPTTTYYVRAYATNNVGTTYGNEIVINTFTDTLTDFQGNVYYTVTIGTQIWMAENLMVTRYRNGDPIPNVTNNSSWSNLTTGSYCDYNNTPANSTIYGKLYNFYAITDTRNVCPLGWHVPSDSQWTILKNYLGSTGAGGKIKETGTTHWQSPNSYATNESGFSALPGGVRNSDGLFYYLWKSAYWWSSTVDNATNAFDYFVNYDMATLIRVNNPKLLGCSVRCLKD
jgi:uncharacterized protein (TIGR02145 family)